MTLEEAVKAFESRFETVQDGPPGCAMENGTEYVTVVSGGVKPNREPIPCHFANEEMAVIMWLAAAVHLTEGKKNLWWRERPVMDHYFLRECDPLGQVTIAKPDGYNPAKPMHNVWSRLVAT